MKQEEILDAVGEFIHENNLTIKSRKYKYVYPRYWLCNFLKENTVLTLSEISNMFGKDDHSLVFHSIKKHKVLYKDRVYGLHTDKVRLRFIGVSLDLPEKVEYGFKERVLRCKTYWQMRKLQDEIRLAETQQQTN